MVEAMRISSILRISNLFKIGHHAISVLFSCQTHKSLFRNKSDFPSTFTQEKQEKRENTPNQVNHSTIYECYMVLTLQVMLYKHLSLNYHLNSR